MSWPGSDRAAAADRSNSLYLKKPELWLEAQARLRCGTSTHRLKPSRCIAKRLHLPVGTGRHGPARGGSRGPPCVVEVKVSEDLHLPLQALDYWIRVRWHAAEDFNARVTFQDCSASPATAPRSGRPRCQFHPTTEALVEHLLDRSI